MTVDEPVVRVIGAGRASLDDRQSADPNDELCTAFSNDPDDRRNPVFVPPCSCPRCAADPIEAGSKRRNWLRVSGRQQRLPVEAMVLGTVGKAVLG